MKSLLLFISLLLFSYHQESNQCVINPSKGVNNIVVGESTIQEVQKEFGEKKIEKKWHKAIETEINGRFEYYIQYDRCCKFSTYTNGRNKKIITLIIIDSASNCKTKNGLGIGSTYNETIKEIGRASQISFVQEGKKNVKMELIYNNMNIWFDGKDSMQNKIVKIEIYKKPH